MNTEMKDKIRLSDSDPGKGAALTLWSDNVELIEKFKGLCYVNLPKSIHWFHQCNSHSYQMFEFWNPQNEAMKESGKRIADNMGLELIVDLNKEYRPGVIVVLSEFQEFEEDMHTFGDFFG